MRRTSRFIGECWAAEGLLLAVATIFAGCSFDANELKAFPGIDSSAGMDGPARGGDVQNRAPDTSNEAGRTDSTTHTDGSLDVSGGLSTDATANSPFDSPALSLVDGAADGPRDVASDPRGDAVGVADGQNDGCVATTIKATALPSDVLLVLDRSGSMTYSTTADTNCAADAGCTDRWSALTSAVNATLTKTSGSIYWGLKLFSTTGNGCGVNSGVEVAISPTSVPAIQTLVGNTSPGGNTPTALAIQTATAYLRTVTDPNNKVILLATDGEPNCAAGGNSTPDVQATIDAITAASLAGFSVYVIGIGPSVGNLDSLAQAGGTTHYYPASSPTDLTAAFAAISQAVTPCTFALPQVPADPKSLTVYLNKNLVQKDAINGWIFGTTTSQIVLTGTLCDSVKANPAVTVEAVGCVGGATGIGGATGTGGTTSPDGAAGSGGANGTGSMTGTGGTTSTNSAPTGTTVAFGNGKGQGAMTGYGFLALGAQDTITDPTCGASKASITNATPCAANPQWSATDKLCISGSIPALPASPTSTDLSNNWGVQVGLNATDPAGGGLGQSFSSVTITVSGTPTSGLRAIVHKKGDPDSKSYCAALTSGTAITFTSFVADCNNTSPAGTKIAADDVPNIDKITVQVSSGSAAIAVSSLCITAITFAK